jgi:hypothetical protein
MLETEEIVHPEMDGTREGLACLCSLPAVLQMTGAQKLHTLGRDAETGVAMTDARLSASIAWPSSWLRGTTDGQTDRQRHERKLIGRGRGRNLWDAAIPACIPIR